RKIESAEHRERLRKILDDLSVPTGYGVIVRTAGMETSTKELQADLESLLELWRTIESAAQQVKAPALVFQERDLVIRTIRDYFTSDIEEVLIDDEAAHHRARKFFEAHMPDKAHLVRLYTGDKPIFSKYNLEDQIERIYKRTVQLKSGGSISIDQTEALNAIDVNSARSTRSASSEDTAARTNLEAAEEIARQLRLRDIGGLIVIDFIDMESSKHIRQVERAFAEAMSRDKARYDVTRISKLGLMEVSRQRLKATKASSSFMECPTCQGDGTVRTPEAAARSAFRKIQARVVKGDISGVKVFLPPEVALHLLNQKRDDLARLEQRYKVVIEVAPEARMKTSQFEIEEFRREETEVAPIVTAATVDEALAAGTLTTAAPRPAEPQETPPAKAAATEPAEASPRGHRRRRRRRGGKGTPAGAPREAGARAEEPFAVAAAPSRGGGREAEAGGALEEQEEPPVFSEGPDTDEGSASRAPVASSDTGPSLPLLAQVPSTEGGLQSPHQRRRRRRRRRGRGAGPGGPPRPSDLAAGHRRAEPASRGAASSGTPREPIPAPLPLPARPPGYSAPPPEQDRPAPVAHQADPGGKIQEEPKPKRQWWRRTFGG
ncbi:MAG: Rne/Rng family ribonuclease, partial [Acidobacteriota bacterium]